MELILDLSLKQNMKGDINTLGPGAFPALFSIVTTDCAFELLF